LENARIKATFEEDTDLKAEIKYVKDQIGEVKSSLLSLAGTLSVMAQNMQPNIIYIPNDMATHNSNMNLIEPSPGYLNVPHPMANYGHGIAKSIIESIDHNYRELQGQDLPLNRIRSGGSQFQKRPDPRKSIQRSGTPGQDQGKSKPDLRRNTMMAKPTKNRPYKTNT
jgi:hypothetical protein